MLLYSWLPQGKEKQNDKSQVKRGFLKKVGNFDKFKKNIRFCQFKLTEFPIFKSLCCKK